MKLTRSLFLLPTLIGVFLMFGASVCQAGYRNIRPDRYPGAVYVIAVGVNHYPAISNQQYGVADARGFTEAIQKGWKSAGVSTDVQLLLDENFTRDALQKAFDHVAARATADDLFIFYYAGLDGTVEDTKSTAGEFYLLTSNCSAVSPAVRQQSLMKFAIPASFLKAECAKIQVKKQLIVLDTCHAGDKLDTLVDQSIQSSEEQKLTEKSVVLMTSEGDALETSDLKHGVLTYSLLQGLAGQAVLSKHFAGITAREMAAYLPVPMIKLSDGIQLFHGYAWGDDFTIAPLPSITPVSPASEPMRQTGVVNKPPATVEAKSSQPGKNYALIFATDHYDEWNGLPNPIHDAQALANELRSQYGFQVEIVQNPTQDDIIDNMEHYRNRSYTFNDQLFIFFAGHGTKGMGVSYIVARDSKKEDKRYKSYFQYADLKSSLLNSPCPHILLALDVCYGGNFAQASAESLPVGPRLTLADLMVSPAFSDPSPDTLRLAARLMKDKSRVFLSSGRDVPVPDGAPGGHSPFMEKLLDALEQGRRQNKVTTARGVYEETLKTPTESEYATFDNRYSEGDFVFVPVKAGTPAF